MKSSEILKKARLLVESGEQAFICNAVYNICVYTESSHKGLEIEKYIHEQLEGEFTLESWLQNRHRIDTYSSDGKLKQTRLQWIDWMIQAYEDKND